MRQRKLATLFALATLVLLSLPAFADSVTVFLQPTDGVYIPSTTNYGGGDGSGGTLGSLGTFNFSTPLLELNVPNSWGIWNGTAATESCTPNVLYTNGAISLTLTLTAHDNTAGFELEGDLFQSEFYTVTYHFSTGSSFFIGRSVNGSAGALLFALQDDTPGAWITSIDIVNDSGDDFAIAQLRQGNSGVIPEPGTMALLGTGLLGALGVIRRKINL
jgi:PEP-CTERM motif